MVVVNALIGRMIGKVVKQVADVVQQGGSNQSIVAAVSHRAGSCLQGVLLLRHGFTAIFTRAAGLKEVEDRLHGIDVCVAHQVARGALWFCFTAGMSRPLLGELAAEDRHRLPLPLFDEPASDGRLRLRSGVVVRHGHNGRHNALTIFG